MLGEAEFTVRRATREDAAGVLDCLHLAFQPYEENYSREGFADTVLTPETIGQRLEEMVIFVAVTPGGEVVGTVGCNLVNDQEGHIRGMAVLPAWQGRGVADRLLAAVESELRDRKCSRVSLDTTEPLQRAIRFYEKKGFRPSGKVGDFYGMPLFEYVKELK